MTRKPEQRLWDRIRSNLGREIHIERLENSVASGTPDTIVLFKSNVLFVEHKVAEAPAKLTTRVQWKHPLTPQQRNWHRTWHQHGGRSCVLVGVDLGLYALPGRKVDEITDMPFAAMQAWSVDYITLANIYQGLMKL